MVTVSTTNPGEARTIIGLIRTAPPGLGCKIYLNGHHVATRPEGGQVQVTDPSGWPVTEDVV